MQPERLRELISPLKGKIGFYYENMIDGDKLSYTMRIMYLRRPAS